MLVSLGVPRLNTPPPVSSSSLPANQDRILAPKPIRTSPRLPRPDDQSQPWTRSPTKAEKEPVLATWHFISSGPAADSSTSGLIIMAELVDCKVMYLES